jgi:hypothetical protein
MSSSLNVTDQHLRPHKATGNITQYLHNVHYRVDKSQLLFPAQHSTGGACPRHIQYVRLETNDG